jgi:glycosyltransferase involved in cell wall biosynthesis
MHILLVNKALIPVFAYGGTERVIWDLGKALTQLGHKVSYLVPAGSSCPFADVIPIDPARSLESQIPDAVDLVHFQSKPDEPDVIRKPWVVTQHGNALEGESLPVNTIFVSRNHAQRHGSQSYVLNGLDWGDYGDPNLAAPEKYLHFLGKAAWRVKNVKGAIDVALHAKRRLEVLGGNRLNIKRGFRLTVSPRISFHGMVGGQVKMNLLRGSAGLVFPVRWHEPFGLAVIESLYFGAPVFATPYGALPEIVKSENGVLSASKAELARAVNEFVANRKLNHQLAQDYFNAKRMAADYLKMYETVISGGKLNPQPPAMNDAAIPLPWA